MSSYDVPCGKCEECRDQYRAMWKCRLWHELDATYKCGGVAVFLTFSYNNDHLPVLEINGVKIPVFNHKDVKTFLNRLKIRMYRLYGRNSYKYFIAMEYGKNTKRQHLHGLFFLSSSVDWMVFVELCRELWCEYGYMFPKFKNGRYIHDDGTDACPLIRNAVKGAVYVSKYVTKDLSYYAIPSVNSVLASDPSVLRPYLPKHFQSNNLGISILDKVDLSNKTDVLSFLTDGITVPYSENRIPVPRYVKKKLCYDNVVSDRIGVRGNRLYDALPSSLLLSIRSMLYERKCQHLRNSVIKIFTRYASLYPTAHIPVIYDYELFANYVLYFKNVNSDVLYSFLTMYDGDLSAFSDSSKVGFFYNLAKDNRFLRDNHFRTTNLHPVDARLVFPAWLFDAYAFWCHASSVCGEVQVKEFSRRSAEREELRFKYLYKYPKNLC